MAERRPRSGSRDATKERSGSRGPPARGSSRGPPQAASSTSSAQGRSSSRGPAPREAQPGTTSSTASNPRRLKLLLEDLFSDECFPYDRPLLLETEDRFAPFAYLARRLSCTEEDLHGAWNHPGVEGADFFELNPDKTRLRRVPKLPKELREAAKRTILDDEYQKPAKQISDRGANDETRQTQICRQVDYYFGADNLPYDLRTLRELDKNGSFPFAYVVSAPALVRMEATEDEVYNAILLSQALKVVSHDVEAGNNSTYDGARVKLRKILSKEYQPIVQRTLERGKSDPTLGVHKAKAMEREYEATKRRTSKGTDSGKRHGDRKREKVGKEW